MIWCSRSRRFLTLLAMASISPITTVPALAETVTFTVGVADGYDAGNGPEEPSPSTGLLLRTGLTSRSFDSRVVNTALLHSFDLSEYRGRITGATLRARMLTVGDFGAGWGPHNDKITLAFTTEVGTPAPLATTWSRYLGDCTMFSNCGPMTDPGLQPEIWSESDIVAAYGPLGFEPTLDLAALPLEAGGTVNLIDELNEEGVLDVLIQDDTDVDYLELEISYLDALVHCIDLGAPDGEDALVGGISSHYGMGVVMSSDLQVDSLGVFMQVTGNVDLEVTVRILGPAGSLGPILATASASFASAAPGWVDVPIDFTFYEGHQYVVYFDQVGGGAGTRPYLIEVNDHDNSALVLADAYAAPPFYVIDGRSGSVGWLNTYTPHFRACQHFDTVPRGTGCTYLGHPTAESTVYYNVDSERGLGVETLAEKDVAAIGIRAALTQPIDYELTVRELSGTTAGDVLARRTLTLNPGYLEFVDIPVDLYLQANTRYQIDFDWVEGGTSIRPFGMELQDFDNPSLSFAAGYTAGDFRILDGRNGNFGWVNSLSPSLRVCAGVQTAPLFGVPLPPWIGWLAALAFSASGVWVLRRLPPRHWDSPD